MKKITKNTDHTQKLKPLVYKWIIKNIVYDVSCQLQCTVLLLKTMLVYYYYSNIDSVCHSNLCVRTVLFSNNNIKNNNNIKKKKLYFIKKCDGLSKHIAVVCCN